MKGVLAALSTELLIHIAKVERLSFDEDSITKKDLLTELEKELNGLGLRVLANNLKKNELEGLVKPLDIQWNGVKNPSKVIMSKRLFEKMNEAGPEDFFTESLSKNSMADLAGHLNVEIDEADKKAWSDPDAKQKIVRKLTEAVFQSGLQSILNHCDVPFLKECCEYLGLEGSDECNTKSKLVYAIATRTAPASLPSFSAAQETKDENLEAAIQAAKKSRKPAIKKGVTYQDLFQWYSVSDLTEWCRDSELKVGGNKGDLINRILAFLDGDKENTMAAPTGNRSRSKSPSRRGRSKSPAKSKKTKSPSKSKKSKAADKEAKESDKEDQMEEEEPEKEESKPKKSTKKTSKKAKDTEPEEKEEDAMEVEKENEEDMEEEDDEENFDDLSGKVFCITGHLSKTRDEIVAVIEKNGGKFIKDVTKEITHLITNEPDKVTAKLTSAKKYKAKIIPEDKISHLY